MEFIIDPIVVFVPYVIAQRSQRWDIAKEFRSIYIDSDVTLLTTTHAAAGTNLGSERIDVNETVTVCLIRICATIWLQLGTTEYECRRPATLADFEAIIRRKNYAKQFEFAKLKTATIFIANTCRLIADYVLRFRLHIAQWTKSISIVWKFWRNLF